jgi:hypothetical protein
MMVSDGAGICLALHSLDTDETPEGGKGHKPLKTRERTSGFHPMAGRGKARFVRLAILMPSKLMRKGKATGDLPRDSRLR